MLCRSAADLDLSNARLVLPSGLSKRESKAVEMLRDEVQKRTQIQLPIAPLAGSPAITISRGRGPAEGYSLQVAGSQVSIIANDARGMLFGIGRLLREMHMRRGRITIAAISTSPPRRNTRCAATSSAIGRRPIPTTAGPSRSGSNTSATWRSSAPTRSS